MKTLLFFKKYSLLFVAIMLVSNLIGQSSQRTIKQSFDAKPTVGYEQTNGPLMILPATDGKITVVSELSVDADEKSEGDRFLNKVELTEKSFSDRVSLRLAFAEVRNRNQRNDEFRIEFRDGDKFKRLRNFKITTRLYLPPTEMLELKNRFNDIEIDQQVSIAGLQLNLHNSDVRGGDISGELRVEARFGKIELGDIGGDLRGNLHNVKLEVGNAGNVRLESRFSQVEMLNVAGLSLTSHNDRYEVGDVKGALDIEERFGTFTLGETQDGKIESHNGNYTIKAGNVYRISGRFTNGEFAKLLSLDLDNNHNCDFEIAQLGSITGEGRFVTVEVEQLTESADLDFHNGKLIIDKLGSKFKGLAMEGRFFGLSANLPKAAQYRVDYDLNFGTADIPDNVVATRKEKEYSHLIFQGGTAGSTTNSPLIKVEGHNGTLKLKER